MLKLAKIIGRRGILTIEQLEVDVEIIDARPVFGRIDYQIKPVAGGGSQWVTSRRVRIADEKNQTDYFNKCLRKYTEKTGNFPHDKQS